MMKVDYSLYLVTDSSMIPKSSTFLKQVEDAIRNGTTLVQLREKELSTSDFIDRAKKVHDLTKAANIPLIINDRLDVALAVDAEGVHVGQDDMPPSIVRKLIGPGKIIGVSCSSEDEVAQVTKEGIADYVGLGAVYYTSTKKDLRVPGGVGPIGIRKMLKVLGKYNNGKSAPIRAVAIGGLNHKNAARVLFQSSVKGQSLDGIAVVSSIMASEDAGLASAKLVQVIKDPLPWEVSTSKILKSESTSMDSKIQSLTTRKPLVHHITNGVVKNFSANVTLAVGASPVMSELGSEYEEFAQNVKYLSLLLNTGTPSPEMMKLFKHALQVYNSYGKHVVLDPVACGATSVRLEGVRQLLNTGHPSVIKGNVGEIMAVNKLTSDFADTEPKEVLMQGVDSVVSLDDDKLINVGKNISNDFKVVVVITGAINYVIEENRVAKIQGGHPLMGSITGSGCSLGSTIAAFLGGRADGTRRETFDIFEATVGAVELYNKSGKEAAESASTPGTFMSKFLDQLYKNTH